MIEVDDLSFVGHGLNRPECVLCHASGRLFVADWSGGGGIGVIEPDGRTWKILARDRTEPLRPNGIALSPDGSFLLTHLGDDDGGVWRLHPDGRSEPVVVEVDGVPLPPSNFVLVEAGGRIWITVSTRLRPRSKGYRPGPGDGFIVLCDDQGARIVADGLGFTNECVVAPGGETLFVNETFARRLTAFDIGPRGHLSNRRTVTEFGDGTFPDGLALDVEGGLWITSIVSNRVIRVAPDGGHDVLIEDADPDHLRWVEDAYTAGGLERPHLDTMRSRRLRNISSLAFGGPDLRSAYLGCLLGDSVARFRAPVAGCAPAHWTYDLSPIVREPAIS